MKTKCWYKKHFVLSFLFVLSVSISNLWDITGLQGDKNGNTRARQPGAKDAHGKLQSLLQGHSWTQQIGLASWANPFDWKCISAALC